MAGRCVRCGQCLAVCPVYKVTGDEKLSARGRQALIDAHLAGRLPAGRVFRRALTACLLCGACERASANDAPVRAKVLAARAGSAGLKRLALAGLAHPERTERLARLGRLALDLAGVAPDSGLRLRLAGQDVRLPALAPRTLRQEFPEPVGPEDGPRIILFPGCLADYALTGSGRAAVRVLAVLGFRVAVPAGLGCCGLPAEAAGLTNLARQRIEATARVLAEAEAGFGRPEAVVTICATCHGRLAERLAQAWPGAPRIVDFSELVAGRLPAGLTPLAERVTFHDPCHSLGPGSPRPAAARRVLQALPGVEFVESNAEPSCCGLGGLFSVLHAGHSAAIGRAKATTLAKSGAATVATTCPACLLRLAELGERGGWRAAHLAELVAERLRD
jgi:glycolate oxidase iron-sulfur subunit